MNEKCRYDAFTSKKKQFHSPDQTLNETRIEGGGADDVDVREFCIKRSGFVDELNAGLYICCMQCLLLINEWNGMVKTGKMGERANNEVGIRECGHSGGQNRNGQKRAGAGSQARMSAFPR